MFPALQFEGHVTFYRKTSAITVLYGKFKLQVSRTNAN